MCSLEMSSCMETWLSFPLFPLHRPQRLLYFHPSATAASRQIAVELRQIAAELRQIAVELRQTVELRQHTVVDIAAPIPHTVRATSEDTAVCSGEDTVHTAEDIDSRKHQCRSDCTQHLPFRAHPQYQPFC